MKNTASNLLKQIMSVIKTIAKAKSALALKSTKLRFSATLKSRLIVLSLLKNKNVLLSSITHKLHAMLPSHDHHHHVNGGLNITIADNNDDDDDDDQSKSTVAVVVQDNLNYHNQSCTSGTYEYMNVIQEEDDDKYPDLTHSFFDDLDNGAGQSVIELVRNSKEKEGEEFVLEDEIDQVADLFIKKFHRQNLMQKQLSLKRYQEMLERSV